jgi:hypothetical protein
VGRRSNQLSGELLEQFAQERILAIHGCFQGC